MPSFPTAVATDAVLQVALNNAQTILAAGIGSADTSLSVVGAAAIASNAVVTIDTERIFLAAVAGVNATGCVRGWGGSTAMAHSAGAVVSANVLAEHHNLLADEIKAIEAALGANLVNVASVASVTAAQADIDATETALGPSLRNVRAATRSTSYAFTATPAQALTATVLATVTLSPFPPGLTASSVGKHYLRITDAVAGNENVSVSGVNVANGTVSFTPAASHASGNWTLGSATAGIQEALYANTGGTPIYIPSGTHTTYRKVQYNGSIRLFGDGPGNTILNATQTNEPVIELIHSGAGTKFCEITQMAFKPASGSFTAGGSLHVEGYTDGLLESLTFSLPFKGIDWYANNSAGGNVVRYTNLVMYAIGSIGLHLRSAGSGQCAALITGFYADGGNPLAIEGTVAGVTATALWFQAITYGVRVVTTSARPANEIVITNFIFDGPTVAGFEIAGFTVTGNGNCVKFSDGLVQTDSGYAAVISLTDNVHISAVRINLAGAGLTGLVIDSSSFVVIDGCTIIALNGASTNGILLQTVSGQVKIKNNVIMQNGGTIGTGIITDGGAHDNLLIAGNSVRATTPITVSSSSVPVMQDNDFGSATVVIASAATIALPAIDNDAVCEITGTTGITRILGGYAGRQVRLHMAGAVTFSTGGVNPGNIGAAFGPTTADQIVLAYFHAGVGRWYLK